MKEIILTDKPEQLFSIAINKIVYSCRVLYNTRSNSWSIDISSGTEDILMGVPLVSGVDIIGQHILDWGLMFVVNTSDLNKDPGREDIGNGAKLMLLTEEEIKNG